MNWDGPSRRELFERAVGEPRDAGTSIDEVRAAVESSGRWENYYEWRISTYGTERVERLARGFRGIADFNGRFRADFESLDEASEAVRTLAWLGKFLFYALGWTEAPSTPTLEADSERPAAEAYF